MDWDRYKRLCDSPPVFTRWMLEQTRELVHHAGGDGRPIELALQANALAKPDDHTGGAASDMFVLELTLQQTTRIAAIVDRAGVLGQATSGTGDRGLGGFVEAWREYENYLMLEQKRDGAAAD